MTPSAWVSRWSGWIPAGGSVLDVACGRGRHTRWLAANGYQVTAVDRDLDGVADLAGDAAVELVQADLETDAGLALGGRRFDGVVVANYLHRPLLDELVAAVAPGGALIYETYARGQERFGKPTNPDWLLRPGELLEAVRGRLRVRGYEDVVLGEPESAAVQRICATAEAQA